MSVLAVIVMGVLAAMFVAPAVDEKFDSPFEKWSRVILIVGSTILLVLLLLHKK